MNKCHYICLGPCYTKTYYGLMPPLVLLSLRTFTFALSMNLVCKELNSIICLCCWDLMIHLFCYLRSLNGLPGYGQYCFSVKASICYWHDMSTLTSVMTSVTYKMIMSFLFRQSTTSFSNE